MAIFGRIFDGLTRFDTFFSFTWTEGPGRQAWRGFDHGQLDIGGARPFLARFGVDRADEIAALDRFGGFDDFVPTARVSDPETVTPTRKLNDSGAGDSFWRERPEGRASDGLSVLDAFPNFDWANGRHMTLVLDQDPDFNLTSQMPSWLMVEAPADAFTPFDDGDAPMGLNPSWPPTGPDDYLI